MTELTPFELAHRRLRGLGVTLERLPGEYRVMGTWQAEADRAYFETLGEAVARGEELASQRPQDVSAGVSPAAAPQARLPKRQGLFQGHAEAAQSKTVGGHG
jgi:hypothetical protein